MLQIRVALIQLATFICLANVLVWRRAAISFGWGVKWRRAAAWVLGVGFVLTVLLRVFSVWVPPAMARAPGIVSGALELAVLVTAALMLPYEAGTAVTALLRGATRRLRRWRGVAESTGPADARARPAEAGAAAPIPSNDSKELEKAETTPKTPEAPAVGRRVLLGQAVTGSAMAVGAGSALYGALFGRHDYEVSTVEIKIAGLPKTWDGTTIVQLSDIHLGLFVGDPEVRAAEQLVRESRPNMIVLTGDLVDHDLRFAPELGRLVRRLADLAPVFGIPGNHDHQAGSNQVMAALARAGGVPLVNDRVPIQQGKSRIWLAGVDDVWGLRLGTGGPDLAAALEAVPEEDPVVLLCHNPVFFPVAEGRIALQLSGHTHGGQVNLGVRPADYVLRHGYIAGHYTRGTSQLYVNRGFGTAGPAARVGAPPEVTRIVLVGA